MPEQASTACNGGLTPAPIRGIGSQRFCLTPASVPHGRGVMARRAITLTILAAGAATLVLAVPSLSSVRHDLMTIDPWWALAAVALEMASCVSFLPVFGAFFDAVPAQVARRVAWIEEASGALFPGGGVTSYAMGGIFLHRAGMDTHKIVIRSGGVFWLTTAVNALALILSALFLLLGVAPGPSDFLHAGLPLAIVATLTLVIAIAPWLVRRGSGARAGRAWRLSLVDGIGEAWRAAQHPSWRLVGAFGYLGFDIAVLFCLFRGFGFHISWAVLILSYLIGYLATIIPVPGGIGVLDGGLVGILVLYGTPAATSVAAVLVYHAISFWVPSVCGLTAWADLTFRPPHSRPTTPEPARSEA